MTKSNLPSSNKSEIVLYTTPDGTVKIDTISQDETIWLSQSKMAELFNIDRSVITKHLTNIYRDEELGKEATCARFAQVQIEGNREVLRKVEFYNLDAIIAVGYRVNSKRATKFRIWATNILKEYIIKGFAMAQAAASKACMPRDHGAYSFHVSLFHPLLYADLS